MRILLVSSFLPFPLTSGGNVRLYNIIKELHGRHHEITLVCEMRRYQTQQDIDELKKFCVFVYTVPRKKQWSFENIIKSVASSYPFLLIGHTNKKMQAIIEELLSKESFDLIHVETFYVNQNVIENSLPIVLVEHNIEYSVYKRFADQAPFVLRPFLAIDIAKIKTWEEYYWKRATKLVAVSEEEKRLMKRDDVVVVPNGVNTEEFRIRNQEPASPAGRSRIKNKGKTILFIGDFAWVQNRDAITFILKSVWPKINYSKFKQVPDSVKLWVVSKHIPESIRKLTNDPNVIFDEDAPAETVAIFQQADVLLAPIRVGGGTSFKILEAMACGIPVITTTLGAEAIEAHGEKDILIADSVPETVKKLEEILTNQQLYTTIAENARKLIEEKYDWKKIVDTLEEVYESALIA